MNIVAIVIDFLLILIVCYFVFKSYRKGFVSALIQVVGYILAGAGAYVGSRALAETTYQLFIRDRLAQSIESSLTQAAAGTNVTSSITAVLDAVPKMLQGMVSSLFGGVNGLTEKFGSLITSTSQSVSATLTDQMLYPIIYALLQSLFFLLLFFAIMVLVRSLSKAFRGVRHIPLLGPVNALLGGMLGLVQAGVFVLVLVVALHLLIGVSGGELPFLPNKTIDDTILFRYIFHWNPFSGSTIDLSGFFK